MKVEFNRDEPTSYGCFRCPHCDARFYGGGKAIHMDGCTSSGYADCILMVGPKAVKGQREYAAKFGENSQHPLTGFTVKDVEGFPED
jgi:hypothetical protein